MSLPVAAIVVSGLGGCLEVLGIAMLSADVGLHWSALSPKRLVRYLWAKVPTIYPFKRPEGGSTTEERLASASRGHAATSWQSLNARGTEDSRFQSVAFLLGQVTAEIDDLRSNQDSAAARIVALEEGLRPAIKDEIRAVELQDIHLRRTSFLLVGAGVVMASVGGVLGGFASLSQS
jgi:hypothetical protein